MRFFAVTVLVFVATLGRAKSNTANYGLAVIDTSKYAVFKFDEEKHSSIFNKSCKPYNLSDNDIIQIESLINKEVTRINKEVKKKGVIKSDLIKNPSKFYKQFVAVKNSKGEKEVWVNCFCYIYDSYKWKTSIVAVLDGGSCYFQLKINLTKNTVYDFTINGVA